LDQRRIEFLFSTSKLNKVITLGANVFLVIKPS
jgi:hypothetical protein